MRKLDPITNICYHIEDNPPPKDVKGLIERLVLNDTANNYLPFYEKLE